MTAMDQQKSLVNSKVLATSEFAVNATIGVDLEKPLKKILSVSAIASVTGSEGIDTDLNIAGKTQVNVVYLAENGALESVMGVADWQNTAKVGGSDLSISVEVAECEVERFSAGEVVVNCLHHALISGKETTSITELPELDDSYVTDNYNLFVAQVAASGSDKFVVADNTEIAASAAEIIACDAGVVVKNVVSGIDQVTVEGVVDLKILYSTADGTNTLSKKVDFRQEVGCMHALPGAEASAIVNVANVTATAEIGEKINFMIAVGLEAKVESYAEANISLVRDIFSLTKQVETTTECVEASTYAGSKYYTDTISSVVGLDAASVDEVIGAVSPKLNISRTVLENGELTIEGVLTCGLIYKDNQAETINSLTLNCPFVSREACTVEGGIGAAQVCASIANVKVRSGKEAEVVFDLSVQAKLYKNTYFEYVSGVTEIGDREESDNAISIYITKNGERIFDVARALGVNPEVIAAQSEGEADSFEAGKRIFVYKPLNIEF